MRQLAPSLALCALGLATIACAAPGAGGSPAPTDVPTIPIPGPSEATATAEPTPAPDGLPPRFWKSYTSGGGSGWWLESGSADPVVLDVEIGQYYDYSPANGKILYASHFATTGGGPGNLAVSDLWIADYPAGAPSALIATDSVVEALWAPDGQGVLYILATPESYELRYRSLTEEDRLVASHVSPTWSISPAGDLVAFTRETGYDVAASPGLYVVPIAGGVETMVSDTDRHGTGSIEDRPVWSADGSKIALANYNVAPGALVIAASDGSFHATLTFSSDLAADPAVASTPLSVLWHPDGNHLVGPASYSDWMGGPSPFYLYELASDGTTVIAATSLGDGYSLIDWNVPGRSFYVVDENNNVVLLALPGW